MKLTLWFGLACVACASACGAGAHVWRDGVGECPEGTRLAQDSDALPSSWWCERPDGTMEGPSVTVHENGRVKELGQHHDGKRDGRWLVFDPLGVKIADVHYEDGARDGTWWSWYSDGARQQRQHYSDDERDGTWLEWWEGGRLREQRQFEHGRPHGHFAWWSEDGVLLRTERYRHGHLLETVRYVDGSETVEISRNTR